MNALVDATPISGPACIYTPQSAFLAIELPTTLTTPNVLEPIDFAFSKAAKVSAVSPD